MDRKTESVEQPVEKSTVTYDESVEFKVSPVSKSRWEAAASRIGIKLPEFVRRACDQLAEETLK